MGVFGSAALVFDPPDGRSEVDYSTIREIWVTFNLPI